MVEINLNLYRIFYEVATCGSFSKAAKKIYISQPAVSKSIKNLEEKLQKKLFHRQNNKIQLTDQGEKLFVYVNSAYNSLITAEKMLLESKDLSHGNIIIGIPSHIATFYLLPHIEKFRNDYPGILVKIISLSTNEMIKELQQNKLDFMIDSSPIIDTLPIDINYNNIKIEHITAFENCFIYNSKKNISLKSIESVAKLPLVLPTKRGSARKVLDKYLKQFNIEAVPILEVETTELIVKSVKMDIGIGYIVKEAIKKELENKTLKEIKFDKDLPKLDINLIYVKNYLSYISKKFINGYLKLKL